MRKKKNEDIRGARNSVCCDVDTIWEYEYGQRGDGWRAKDGQVRIRGNAIAVLYSYDQYAQTVKKSDTVILLKQV